MKTISGKLVSVQPISLSKAARYISDFASFENNGVSEVVSIYLNRASEAFSSLVRFHKELKHPQSSQKKKRKKSDRGRESGSSLRSDDMNCDDRERKSGRYDENRGELEDKRVEGVGKEEGESARVGGIEDMGTRKKRKEMHKKEGVKLEDSVRRESGKGGEDGGIVEVQNLANGFVDQTKKKKNKKKNYNVQKGVKMEDSVAVESRVGETGSGSRVEKGNRNNEEKKMKRRKENETKTDKEAEMSVGQGKKYKKKKRVEIEMKEMRREGKLDVDQERESKKKKRKSADLDDDLKENIVEPTRKKLKKSKVAGH